MNQNNNIIGYDSQTGQPIYATQPNQNINMQQSQMNMPSPVQNQPPKKSNKVLIIIVILLVIGIIGTILYFNSQNKKEVTNNDTQNSTEVENNNQSNEQQESSAIGFVEEGTITTYDENGAFLLNVTDVSSNTNTGVSASGTVLRGKVKAGDTIQIVGLNKEILTTKVTTIGTGREQVEEASVGDIVEVGLKDISKDLVKIGQVLAKPNSIVAATKFDADVYILSKEEGGRRTPISDGYKSQFIFRTTDITGTVTLPSSIKTVNPGEKVSFTTTLEENIAMEIGNEFFIREGGRKVAVGTVTKIY